MTNSVDPDETARYEHLDLHCIQWYLFRSVWMKWLSGIHTF